MSGNVEYEKFRALVRSVIRVPHDELKAKLDAEKRAKRCRGSKAASVSREAADKD